MATLTIPARCNGPLERGQGGFSTGALAALAGGPVAVSLRRPVPLEVPLEVVAADRGGLRALHDDEVVIEAEPAPPLELEVPAPVDPAGARAAAERYPGTKDSVFSRCYVCGRAREDAFGIFPGPVEGRDVVAAPWTPPAWTAGEDGVVAAPHVWAALDCPTHFAAFPDPRIMAFLARFETRIDAPVRAGEEHVVMAWPLGAEGRKHHADAALLDAGGAVLARARALIIEARAEK